jgi:hypothetical protein
MRSQAVALVVLHVQGLHLILKTQRLTARLDGHDERSLRRIGCAKERHWLPSLDRFLSDVPLIEPPFDKNKAIPSLSWTHVPGPQRGPVT